MQSVDKNVKTMDKKMKNTNKKMKNTNNKMRTTREQNDSKILNTKKRKIHYIKNKSIFNSNPISHQSYIIILHHKNVSICHLSFFYITFKIFFQFKKFKKINFKLKI